MNFLKKIVSIFTCIVLIQNVYVNAHGYNISNDVATVQENTCCYPEEWVTDRLIVKPSTSEDLPELGKMFVSYNVSKYMMSIPLQLYSEKQAEDFLKQNILERYAKPYTIKLKESGKIIGQIAYLVVGSGCLELTYWLGEDYQGKGYASEAIIDLSDCIFSRAHNLNSLKIEFMKENVASKKLATKIVSNLINSNPSYELVAMPDKIKNVEVMKVGEMSVFLRSTNEDSSLGKSVNYSSRMKDIFPQEYMKEGIKFNCDECCLYVRKR